MPTGELKGIRRQASLYLYGFPEIENARRRFNPAQAALIPAHVTLCREDEVQDWDMLQQRFSRMLPIRLSIEFGAPVRDGDCVYLPAVGSTKPFDDLREQALGIDGMLPRKHMPHITLIHPRNGSCDDVIYQELLGRLKPFTAIFEEVSSIEQRDGGKWTRFARVGPLA